FFQAEDGIRDPLVTGVQTCALPISRRLLKLLQELENQSGFAHARLCNQGLEAAAGFDAAGQGVERLAVGSTGVYEARIRRHAERLLVQPIEFQEHGAATFDSPTRRGTQQKPRPVGPQPDRGGAWPPSESRPKALQWYSSYACSCFAISKDNCVSTPSLGCNSGTQQLVARSRFSRRFISERNVLSIRLLKSSDKHKLLATRARSKAHSPM